MIDLADPDVRRHVTVTLMRFGHAPDAVFLDDAMAFVRAVGEDTN